MENENLFEAFNNRLRLRVSGICINNQEKILLIRHRYPGKRSYLIAPPGGEMQFGEQAHEALKREFKEETGLEIEIGPLQFVHEFKQERLHAVELFFKVKAKEKGKIHVGTDPELESEKEIITHVEWMNVVELKNHPKQCLHYCLRDLNHISALEKISGYSIEID